MVSAASAIAAASTEASARMGLALERSAAASETVRNLVMVRATIVNDSHSQ
jgi:hypothetical protein